MKIPLPTKQPPFDERGEQQIYDAVMVHGMRHVTVADRCECSVNTVYAILKRVEARMNPQTDPGDENHAD